MRTPLLGILWVCLISSTIPAFAQNETELDILRAEIAQMRADYELRIAQLEDRLDEAEKRAAIQKNNTIQAESLATEPADSWQPDPYAEQMLVGKENASNPAIGVVFQGQAWSYSNDPDDYEIPGFPLGGEAGPLPEGLALGET